MHSEGLTSDVVTLTCVLKACGIVRAIDMGKQIHEDILSRGLLKKDIMLGTALVDMYAKWGDLAKAQEVLEELHIRDVVCWSALIAGYCERGQDREALNTFERMQSEGISPTVLTFIRTLTSCGIMGAINKGRQIHKEIVDRGLLEKDIVLGNALVGMYVKCGELAIAHKVLEELPVRNAISWSALISGYAEHDRCHEALNCFEWMQSEGLSPNTVTFMCILKACGSAGATDKGKQIHDEIARKQLLGKDTMLGTALIDMYAKCGLLLKAQQVLEELSVQDVISWNSLIAGYAQQGQGQDALNCFSRMQNEGLSPDEVTFLCVLSACCRSGLLYHAESLFEDMTRKYGIIPNVEHHTCMVIAYGCAGHFDSAVTLIKATASLDYAVIWLALLGSCKRWENVKLGRVAFDQAVQLDSACSAAYVLMVGIFSAAGMLEDAEKLEAMRTKYASGKEGSSPCFDASVDIDLGIDIILK
jgi:pentatricopeptide repeat protein